MKSTTIALPENFVFVFKRQWEMRLNDPCKYRLSAYWHKQANLNSIKFNSKSIRVPFTGESTVLTQSIYDLLDLIFKSSVKKGLITQNDGLLYLAKLKNWKKTGEFKKSVQKKRLKTIKSKRGDFYLTPEEQVRRSKLAPLLQKRIESLVCEYVRASFKLFPDLPSSLAGLREVKYTTAPSITRSSGGISGGNPYMKFALSRIMIELDDQGTDLIFHEYDSFKDDDVIGSIGGSIEVYLSALVAHELAHAIQYTLWINNMFDQPTWNGLKTIDMTEGHGEGWRYIYGVLRKTITNRLPDAKRVA
ncbi:hypothetical protein [Vibrio sp. D431a]|uniref:hypothetical protein n=1 Tax=Vibrio sp. D431a TaxID=2837388 RepID=UPI0025521BE4|nr:hypothetical protein [Vibrio sp. D431a]MDK9789893.1 hypothetical protein [Vibrio sp. D431a]